MKILHLPRSIAGHAWGLAQAERELGLESKVLSIEDNQFDFPADIKLKIGRSKLKALSFLPREFVRIRNNFDIFHFNMGSSLINFVGYRLYQIELPFYPRKTKLFVTFNGCDARQKYLTINRTDISACHEEDCYSRICNFGRFDYRRKKAIDKISQYVKHIWALNPDLLYFLPKEKSSFFPYIIPNWDKLKSSVPDFSKRRLKIIHAPTNRVVKGTKYITDALEKLKDRYPDYVDFQVIENISYRKVLGLYESADLAIDQVLIGWYGSFAVEMMKMGRPVLVRISEEDLHFLPSQMAKDVLEAVINVSPQNIYETLVRCIIEDRNILKEKFGAGLGYVNKWHNPLRAAQITRQAYESFGP